MHPLPRLQFVCSQDLISQTIAWWGVGPGGVAHVDAVMPDGRLLGAHADEIDGIRPGVRIRPADYGVWIRRIVVEFPHVSDLQALEWRHWLKAQCGDPYDMGAIKGFLADARLHLRGHWDCSALQTQGLRRLGIFGELPFPDWQVTPDALLLMCCAVGARVIEVVGDTARRYSRLTPIAAA
jgi:hypothetical protein